MYILFGVVTLFHLPISFMVTALTLRKTYDCPSASAMILTDMTQTPMCTIYPHKMCICLSIGVVTLSFIGISAIHSLLFFRIASGVNGIQLQVTLYN